MVELIPKGYSGGVDRNPIYNAWCIQQVFALEVDNPKKKCGEITTTDSTSKAGQTYSIECGGTYGKPIISLLQSAICTLYKYNLLSLFNETWDCGTQQNLHIYQGK